jgi:hypothetical protein
MRASTPKWITLPRSLASLKKAVQGHANLYSMMGWDDVYQKALFPHLSGT